MCRPRVEENLVDTYILFLFKFLTLSANPNGFAAGGKDLLALAFVLFSETQRLFATMVWLWPLYTAKPVRSQLGTPGDFTFLSQVSCVKPRGSNPPFITAQASLVHWRRRGCAQSLDLFRIICLLLNFFIFL